MGRRCWKEVRLRNPRLRVHLRLEGKPRHKEIIWQQGAPVKSVLYHSPYTQVSGAQTPAAGFGHPLTPPTNIFDDEAIMVREITSSLRPGGFL